MESNKLALQMDDICSKSIRCMDKNRFLDSKKSVDFTQENILLKILTIIYIKLSYDNNKITKIKGGSSMCILVENMNHGLREQLTPLSALSDKKDY